MKDITKIQGSTIVRDKEVKLVAKKWNRRAEFNETDDAEKVLHYLSNALPYPTWVDLLCLIIEQENLKYKDEDKQASYIERKKIIEDLRVSKNGKK